MVGTELYAGRPGDGTFLGALTTCLHFVVMLSLREKSCIVAHMKK